MLSGGLGRLRTAGPFRPAAEEGIKGLGHDVRGARTAVSAGSTITGAALSGRHDQGPQGRSEDVTIPLPSLFPQGLTVSISTQNARSHKAHYVEQKRLRLSSTHPTVGVPDSTADVYSIGKLRLRATLTFGANSNLRIYNVSTKAALPTNCQHWV